MALKGQTYSPSNEWIELILHYLLCLTIKKLSTFLGVTGYCSIGIPRFAALARSLYQLLKDDQCGSQSLLEWNPENSKTFQTLKSSLQTAPAVALPIQNCFQLYVYEKWREALGALKAHSTTSGIVEQRIRQYG
jgi:hypothetical protein